MGMSDKERILKGLEHCERRWVGAVRVDEDYPCRTCPYHDMGYACIAHLITDTLELMRLPEHQVCANCCERAYKERCRSYRRMGAEIERSTSL